ncbi:MAG: DUF4956 domain-containing protein [Bacteroidaceae bacterium]|nr:DUF4956 domain-containing protein [Bacteroidaceae bacterium]
MEELEFLETPLIDATNMTQLLLHFIVNLFFVGIIIHKLYYPKSQRRDYYFTFALISISIFLMIFLLGSVKIKVGFALGLFAIFGIIRYRTEQMPVREMTYLFVLIAVSVINALAVTLTYAELIMTNCLFILCIWLGEDVPWLKKSVQEKLVLYDRIDLIQPERRKELIADLETRLGFSIKRVEVGAVDFLRDVVMIKVFYEGEDSNSVNQMLKFPKIN